MKGQEIRPSRWYCVLSAVVLVVGCLAFALILWRDLGGTEKSLVQIIVPGESEFTLSQAGEYAVFYESESVVGNRVFSSGANLPGIECSLVSSATGTPVTLVRPRMSTTYTFGGRSGESVLAFRISEPGKYRFSAHYPEGQRGTEVVFAIGPDFGKHLFATVALSLSILFLSVGAGIAITVITLVKRRNAKAKLCDRTSLGTAQVPPQVGVAQ